MKILIIIISSIVMTLTHAAINTPWKDFSAPGIMSSNFEYRFEKLPLKGRVEDPQKIWANDYWPRKKGGINYRWNSPRPEGFKLKSPEKSLALRMSFHELATLAPSEKLDLLNGHYAYPLVKEVDENASPDAPLWHGICNGWSPAAINHNEPIAKTLTNPDGVQVPFGSSDIKALLSYYYAFYHEVKSTHQMGKRCHIPYLDPNCGDDLNAGAFHIVLTNRVGLDGASFVADVEGGRQVWNHAVSEFNTKVVESFSPPEKDSAEGTVRRVRVKTDMTFVLKITENSWEPVLGTDKHVNDVKHYEYYLELDAFGRIIGGEWVSKARPDFLWIMEKATEFKGAFSRMPELLND